MGGCVMETGLRAEIGNLLNWGLDGIYAKSVDVGRGWGRDAYGVHWGDCEGYGAGTYVSAYGDISDHGIWGDGWGRPEFENEMRYWAACVDGFAAKWPAAQRQRLAQLRAEGAVIAYWRSDKRGCATNGGVSTIPVQVGTIEEVPGPLKLCSGCALHATLSPLSAFAGQRLWVVALIGEISSDGLFMLGALKREIIGECV